MLYRDDSLCRALLNYIETSVKARYNSGFKYCCILNVNNNTQYIVNYNAKCFTSFILIAYIINIIISQI